MHIKPVSPPLRSPRPNERRLPPGNYDARINYVSVKFMENGGYFRVHVNFEVTDPEYLGLQEYKQYQLSTPKAVNFMRSELIRIGIYVGESEMLHEACGRLEDRHVRIKVVGTDENSRTVYLCGPSLWRIEDDDLESELDEKP